VTISAKPREWSFLEWVWVCNSIGMDARNLLLA
jgi:hypothetical protein